MNRFLGEREGTTFQTLISRSNVNASGLEGKEKKEEQEVPPLFLITKKREKRMNSEKDLQEMTDKELEEYLEKLRKEASRESSSGKKSQAKKKRKERRSKKKKTFVDTNDDEIEKL